MTPKQKAKKWVKENGGWHSIMTAKEFWKRLEYAFLAGYEQAEFDAWFKYSRLAFEELKRFSKRYDLQDEAKK